MFKRLKISLLVFVMAAAPLLFIAGCQSGSKKCCGSAGASGCCAPAKKCCGSAGAAGCCAK